MKRSSTLRAFAAFAFLAGAAPVGAQDYQCQDASGCVATIYQDGAARRVLFRHGDASEPPKRGWGDPACPGPPRAGFSPHGIDLAQRADGRLVLAAVQHAGRESIELFEVSGRDGDWELAWRGCWIGWTTTAC